MYSRDNPTEALQAKMLTPDKSDGSLCRKAAGTAAPGKRRLNTVATQRHGDTATPHHIAWMSDMMGWQVAKSAAGGSLVHGFNRTIDWRVVRRLAARKPTGHGAHSVHSVAVAHGCGWRSTHHHCNSCIGPSSHRARADRTRSDFGAICRFDVLHRRGTVTEAMLYAFDLLELDGEDLRGLPVNDRKKRLARLVGKRRIGIVLSDHTAEDGALLFMHACRRGLEGVVSKRLSAPYQSGPLRDWLK